MFCPYMTIGVSTISRIICSEPMPLNSMVDSRERIVNWCFTPQPNSTPRIHQCNVLLRGIGSEQIIREIVETPIVMYGKTLILSALLIPKLVKTLF